jgi:hypothetical protein
VPRYFGGIGGWVHILLVLAIITLLFTLVGEQKTV